MNGDRIDFISAYCDRWCERCAFTDRCSLFACQAAAAMCGDFAEGLELAVGVPQPIDGETREPTVGEQLIAEMAEHSPSAEEMATIVREEDARQARVAAMPLIALVRDYTHRATAWPDEGRGRLAGGADPILKEALEIVADQLRISSERNCTERYMDAMSTLQGEAWEDEGPIQND